MTVLFRRLVLPVAFCYLAASLSHAEPNPAASLTGTVRDASGGMVPGVAITATPRGANQPVTVFSDGEGGYAFDGLTPGEYDVSFELGGFNPPTPATVDLRPGQPVTLHQILEVATLQESVTVVAQAPPEEPARVPPPPPRVFAEAAPVMEHASVCGPRPVAIDAPLVASVAAVKADPRRMVLGDRDIVFLTAGHGGLEVGANLVVRRRFVVNPGAASPQDRLLAEHTAALIQVVGMKETEVAARVVYMCDEVLVGDRVEPFEPQPRPVRDSGGSPDFHAPARVLFADHGRTVAAPAEFLVISGGADDGARPGQRVTMFRHDPARGEVAVGEAMIVAVQPWSATIRIENARDVIEVGDRAALHR